jgi:hypothetical protein
LKCDGECEQLRGVCRKLRLRRIFAQRLTEIKSEQPDGQMIGGARTLKEK